jgi:protein-tyrosine phosphatase
MCTGCRPGKSGKQEKLMGKLDLHCHILPGVDDGPATLDEALAVARLLVADGVTHVTATPHCHRYLRLLRADILPEVARLNAELARHGIPLTVLPGSEIQVTDSAAYRRDYEAGVLCHLGDGPAFSLTEFPWQGSLYPPDAADLIVWMRERGTTALIAHPERHDYFRNDAARLPSLSAGGAWIQLTVDSLLGNHGPGAASAAEQFLAAFPSAVLATDAHGADRCSGLSPGYEWVRRRFGEARAGDLRERSDDVLRTLLARGTTAPSALEVRHQPVGH